ncbi:MAG: prolyl oligopeptidase family serine peptidase [Pseudomonadota bacterium]
MKSFALAMSVLGLAAACAGQDASDEGQAGFLSGAERRARVENALAGGLDFPGVEIEQAQWLSDDRLLLRTMRAAGSEWLLYETAGGAAEPAFDHGAVAAAAAEALEAAVLSGEGDILSQISAVTLGEARGAVSFDLAGRRLTCSAAPVVCANDGPAYDTDRQWPRGADVFGVMGPAAVRSGDGRAFARRNGPNVEIIDARTGATLVKTTDGAEGYSYGDTLPTSWSGRAQMQIKGLESPADGLWSADNRYFLTFLIDNRHTRVLGLSRSQPGQDRATPPDIVYYRAPLPTDEKPVQARYVVMDTQTGEVRTVDMPWISAPIDPVKSRFVQWKDGASTTKFYFMSHTAGARQITLWEADAATGAVRKVRTEESNTQAGVTGSNVQYGLEDIPNSDDYIWYSDREGRGRFYRIDGDTGEILHAISSETVTALHVKHIDVDNDAVYFTAYPRADETDPDRVQLYRAPLSGGEQVRLTDLERHHDIAFSPTGGHYLDIASLIEVPPTAHVVSVSPDSEGPSKGALIIESSPDGWALPEAARPERFEVLAADGETKIYGQITRPSYWSPEGRYPIVNWVYGSAEYAVAQEGFSERSRLFQAIAEGGFIVVSLDSRGTPGRSKAFNDYGIGAAHNRCGVEDHVAAMRQLAERDPTIDITRAAIGGSSGGGQCSYRFALRAPDFFKAAVISAPSTDPYILGPLYIENFLGVYRETPPSDSSGAQDETEAFNEFGGSGDASPRLFNASLTGASPRPLWIAAADTKPSQQSLQSLTSGDGERPKIYVEGADDPFIEDVKADLFFVHGELDEDVHPANTLRILDQLIKKNKVFELLIVPGANHNTRTDYVLLRIADFYSRSLYGSALLANDQE